jgi:hypothetical protein
MFQFEFRWEGKRTASDECIFHPQYHFTDFGGGHAVVEGDVELGSVFLPITESDDEPVQDDELG